MADEAGCGDLYRFAYAPFSAAVHNMWHHIVDYNLETCENPLHAYHRVPVDPDLPIDPDYLYRAAKYLDKSFRLFDRKSGVSVDVESSLKTLVESLNELNEQLPSALGSEENGEAIDDSPEE